MICRVLHCTPDDLFSWRDTSDGKLQKAHINKLKRGKSNGNMASYHYLV